jgi:hypothetical protein
MKQSDRDIYYQRAESAPKGKGKVAWDYWCTAAAFIENGLKHGHLKREGAIDFVELCRQNARSAL